MTDRKVCASCSSASMTCNQALYHPGYDQSPLLSSSCWYSPFTSVTWPILLAQIYQQHRWFLLMCTSGVPSHQSRENVSTLTSNTAKQLVPHLDAFLLECEWENHLIWPERSSRKDILLDRIRATSTTVIFISRGLISRFRSQRTLLHVQPVVKSHVYVQKTLKLLKHRLANLAQIFRAAQEGLEKLR